MLACSSISCTLIACVAVAQSPQVLDRFVPEHHPGGHCSEWFLSWSGPWSIGDFDGNGFDDFAIRRVITYPRSDPGCGQIPTSVIISDYFLHDGFGNELLQIGMRDVFGLGAEDDVFGVGDFNGDGFDDVFVQRTGFGPLTSYLAAGPTGAAIVSLPRHFPFDPSFAFPDVAVGDLNGDGYDDIALPVPGALELYLGPQGTLLRVIPLPGVQDFAAIGDWDADGGDDLVLIASGSTDAYVCGVSGRDGTVMFTIPRDASWPEIDYATAVGDVDGGGRVDFVVGSLGSVRSSVLFSAESLPPLHVGSSGDPASPVVLQGVGDVDGDRRADLLTTGRRVLSGADYSELHPGPVRNGVGDINGDGGADLAVAFGFYPVGIDVLDLLPVGNDSGRAWNLGAGCPGADGRQRVVDWIGHADLGSTMRVLLRGGIASSSIVLHAGDPTSLALDPFGAPECTLLVAPFLTFGATTDANGYADLAIPFPPGIAPIGERFDFQWAMLDPMTNALGVTLSSALAVTVDG